MNDHKISDRDDAVTAIPRPLRVSAAASWRILVVLGALYLLGMALARMSLVVIPVAIALLLSALLAPAVSRLAKWGVPRALATAVVLIAGLGLVGGVLTFVINNFIANFPELQRQVMLSLNGIQQQLANGPLHLGQEQLLGYLDQAGQWVQDNQAAVTSGALSTATSFGNALTGLVLVLFTLIFFLHDGRRVWLFVIRIVPSGSRNRIDVAGSRGFASLVGYVRATALVAVADALGIGLGLMLLGVPLAVPLATLVFLGGFVPIVGAVASGLVAVLVALVTNGWITALIVVGIVLAVQQLEGNVLQPLLLGRAVQLHPLAVVLAISAGAIIAGIVGALLAVPLVAVLNSAMRSLVAGESDSDHVDVIDPHEAKPPDSINPEVTAELPSERNSDDSPEPGSSSSDSSDSSDDSTGSGGSGPSTST